MLDRVMEIKGKTNRGKSRIGYRTEMPIVNDFGRYQAEILNAASGCVYCTLMTIYHFDEDLEHI